MLCQMKVRFGMSICFVHRLSRFTQVMEVA